MSDIARALGISTASVSNALSGKGRVSANLSQQISDKAREIGYVPSLAGKALSTGKSHVLGLVLADIGNPLFPQIAQAIEQAASDEGYGVLIGDSRGDVHLQTTAISRLIQRGADGIIVIPRYGTRIAALNHPTVMIDAPSTPGNTVSANHWQGGVLIGRHLRDLGHTNLAIIGMNHQSNVQLDRAGGIREGFGSSQHVKTIWIDALEEDHGPGCEIGAAAIAESGVTAFAAVSDLHALRVVSELQRAGIVLPDQASVTGFDDLVWAAAIAPALTTVRMDMDTIARIAVAQLLRQIDPGWKPSRDRASDVSFGSRRGQYAVPMKLIVRQSSARPASGSSTDPHQTMIQKITGTELP